MKPLQVAGYVGWFVGCFVLGLVLTFPLDGFKPLIINSAEQLLGKGKQGPHGVDPVVTLDSINVSGLGVKAKRVHVQLPSREPEAGPDVDVDEVWMSFRSLLSMASAEKSFNIQGRLYGGSLSASGHVDEKQNFLDADIEIDNVELGKVPLLIAKLGVPIEGEIDADIELDMGKQADKDAAGHIDLDVKGLAIGVGNLKAAMGFEISEPIRLGNLKGRIPIKQGIGTIEILKLEGATDVEAEVVGTVSIKARPLLSRIDIDGWFHPTTQFLDKTPKFKSILEIGEKLSMPGAPSLSKAKDEEGRYHFSAKGALQNVVPQLSKDAGKRAKNRSTKAATTTATTPPPPAANDDEAAAAPPPKGDE